MGRPARLYPIVSVRCWQCELSGQISLQVEDGEKPLQEVQLFLVGDNMVDGPEGDATKKPQPAAVLHKVLGTAILARPAHCPSSARALPNENT